MIPEIYKAPALSAAPARLIIAIRGVDHAMECPPDGNTVAKAQKSEIPRYQEWYTMTLKASKTKKAC